MLLTLMAPINRLIDFNLLSGAIPDGATFERASTGTRFNVLGSMVTEAIDAPRFDYDPITHALLGLLIEPQATNLIITQDFTAYAVLYTGHAEASAHLDPTGAAYAYDVIDEDASSIAGCRRSATIPTDGIYTTSVFVRKDSTPYTTRTAGFRLLLDTMYTCLDTSTGIPSSSGLVIDYGDYYRVYRPASMTAGSSWLWLIGAFNATLGTTAQYSLLGGSTMCFASLEEGSKPTSYIPTSGAAATRAADQLSFAIPSGVSALRYVFDDDSTQYVAVSAGAYTVPTNLNRSHIKRIQEI